MPNRPPREVRLAAVALALVLSAAIAACTSSGRSPATERTQVLADWEALRFGMFIHFGMSTFTGYEFGEFSAQAKAYAPTALDVDQWIRVAREGGMKYAVLTTKHCYGHALWDSQLTDYDVASGPVTTDVVRPSSTPAASTTSSPGSITCWAGTRSTSGRARPRTTKRSAADRSRSS